LPDLDGRGPREDIGFPLQVFAVVAIAAIVAMTWWAW